ncbi:5'-nucleotidase C-terminal domain-containing protein [Paenibacillus larvae]|nr:5'-nucleotidase C-terminal domain-containing protein [Paenibacillus larvae]MDT2238225.1 5'-nucleotidase C-terminal domain-containing protein [Paenibacillus larvae]
MIRTFYICLQKQEGGTTGPRCGGCKIVLPLKNDWYAASPLGNLLADSLRRFTRTELSLVNAGQLLGGLEAGSVTKGRLLEICPSPINPCRIKLRGNK